MQYPGIDLGTMLNGQNGSSSIVHDKVAPNLDQSKTKNMTNHKKHPNGAQTNPQHGKNQSGNTDTSIYYVYGAIALGAVLYSISK